MKARKERQQLLEWCRSILLELSDEQLCGLLEYWFDLLMGEDVIEELVDDCCLLLDYRVVSASTGQEYWTYTAWREIEGSETLDGIFHCADKVALRLCITALASEQVEQVVALAYQAYRVVKGENCNRTNNIAMEFLRAFVALLWETARPGLKPRVESKEERREREFELVAQAQVEYEDLLEVLAQKRALQVQTTTHVKADPPWLKALKRVRSQQPSSKPLIGEVVVTEEIASILTKEQLSAFMDLPLRSRVTKGELIQRLLAGLAAEPVATAQFFEVFACELALEPWELEELLGCSPTERKRWTVEGKLPIQETRKFRKGGSNIGYPVYERRAILTLGQEMLELWRIEHKVQVHEHRKAGAIAAAATRRAMEDGKKNAAEDG